MIFRTIRLRFRSVVGNVRGRLLALADGLRWYATYRVGKIPSQTVRMLFYRRILCANIAPHVVIYLGAEIRSPANLSVGNNTIIGNDVILDARAGLRIGLNVNLSSQVAIWTNQHDPQSSEFAVETGEVVVEDYAWLSFRSVILPGVTIGEGAVVAACAVVTKDVAPYTIVAGIPAKVIGTRNRDLQYKFTGTFIPFM